MIIPSEFLKFGLHMHQDFLLYGPEPRDWIGGALAGVPKPRHQVLRNYVDGLIRSDLSNDELKAIWMSTNTDVFFEGDFRSFFKMILDAIDQAAKSEPR